MSSKLLTTVELCKTLQTSRRNINFMRKKGMPYYLLSLGGHPRFDLEKVKEWLEKNTEKASN